MSSLFLGQSAVEFGFWKLPASKVSAGLRGGGHHVPVASWLRYQKCTGEMPGQLPQIRSGGGSLDHLEGARKLSFDPIGYDAQGKEPLTVENVRRSLPLADNSISLALKSKTERHLSQAKTIA